MIVPVVGPSAPGADGPTPDTNLFAEAVAEVLSGTAFTTTLQHRWLATTFENSRPQPAQGWKLHVSAHPATAADVLARALPVLRRHEVRFKVAASPRALMILNAGAAGPSQIGKFITVYPETDDQATALAAELDAATQGLSGPRVPSDRPLRRGSLVHYRFGSFTGATLMQLVDGTVVSALTTPAGEVEPDERLPVYAPPPWVVDPFPAGEDPQELPRLGDSADRSGFRVLGLLSDTGRGPVFIGVDLTRRRRCVFKAAARGAGDRPADSETALRREAALLHSLPVNPAWPAVFDLVETDDQLLLAMEDIEGTSVGEHVADRAMLGRPLQTTEVAEFALQITEAVMALHQQGVVHRDLKSSNLLVRPDGGVTLIDFEHAAPAGRWGRSGGTRGYMSPQQRAGHPAAYPDDIFAAGALLMLLATGCEPSQAPDGENLSTRPLELLRPGIAPELARLIRACLSGSLEDRPGRITEVSAALREIHRLEGATERPLVPAARARVPEKEAGSLTTSQLVETARRLCDSLCDRAVPAANGALTWISTAPGTLPVPYRQINNGVPGILLGLASGWAAGGAERHRDALTRGARWLAESRELPGAKVSGLYAGEAGVGAALLLAGLTSRDRDMIDAAYECELRLRAYPFEAADLYHGTAGRLRFLAMLWLLDKDRDVLSHALRCANHLHDKAMTQGGQSWWKGEDHTGGLAVASYAHGTAGIADALLDLYEITGDSQHLDLARGAASWVTSQAVPNLPDSSGLDWGNGGAFGGLWCYGASGVGLLYLHLLHLEEDCGAHQIAKRAGRTVSLAGRYAGPGLCHGLAGSIEYLLDLHQHTGDRRWLRQSWELQRLMDAYRRQRPGGIGYPSTGEDDSDISYMLGDAGLVGTLLRQAADGRLPRLLSTDAIRYLSGRPPRPGTGQS